jgi:hypothetical protein
MNVSPTEFVARAVAALVAAAVLVGGAAASTTASIDRFVITRSTPPAALGLFYDDQFSNGLPPVHLIPEPAGGGTFGTTPGQYALTGTFPAGAESGGKLSLDPNGGGLVEAANGALSRPVFVSAPGAYARLRR